MRRPNRTIGRGFEPQSGPVAVGGTHLSEGWKRFGGPGVRGSDGRPRDAGYTLGSSLGTQQTRLVDRDLSTFTCAHHVHPAPVFTSPACAPLCQLVCCCYLRWRSCLCLLERGRGTKRSVDPLTPAHRAETPTAFAQADLMRKCIKLPPKNAVSCKNGMCADTHEEVPPDALASRLTQSLAPRRLPLCSCTSLYVCRREPLQTEPTSPTASALLVRPQLTLGRRCHASAAVPHTFRHCAHSSSVICFLSSVCLGIMQVGINKHKYKQDLTDESEFA
ncbi:unnamed protein product [Protopolystoma xenopodis]|uniref:Uncharacterized protein n=1 Tax=Protopolystoma xenopodis TaxID=117903 RepID=A0A3S5AEW9_9PLAT|nr:unnamed protein product [Protopolystoma xenopodis]